jgi:hypothetical protein
MVVVVGEAVGFCIVVPLNPVAGDQDQDTTGVLLLPINGRLLPIHT